jgi:hypothetical protein
MRLKNFVFIGMLDLAFPMWRLIIIASVIYDCKIAPNAAFFVKQMRHFFVNFAFHGK